MLAHLPSTLRRSHATRARPAIFVCFVCFVVPLLLGAAEPAPKLHRGPVQPHWLGNSSRFWYRNDLPGGAVEFILVDAARGSREIAFDATVAFHLSANSRRMAPENLSDKTN